MAAEHDPFLAACKAVGVSPESFITDSISPKFRDFLSEQADAYCLTALNHLYLRFFRQLFQQDIDLTSLSAPVLRFLTKLTERFDPKAVPTRHVIHSDNRDPEFEQMDSRQMAEWLADHRPNHIQGLRVLDGQSRIEPKRNVEPPKGESDAG